MAAVYDDQGNFLYDDGTGSSTPDAPAPAAVTDIPANRDTPVQDPNAGLTAAQQYAAYGAGGGGAGSATVPGNGTDSGTTAAAASSFPSLSSMGSSVSDFAKSLGLSTQQLLGLGLSATQLAGAMNQPAYNPRSASSLLSGLPSNAPSLSAGALTAMAQPVNAGAALKRQTMSAQPKSIVAGTRGYAAGGEVAGPLSSVPPPGPSGPGMAPPGGPQQAFSGPVPSDTGGGQDDLFDAKLAGGEFVFDAETVSMMGDGNTDAGIQKLEELRQQVRDQKRNTPNNQIPAPMQGPLSSMQGPQ